LVLASMVSLLAVAAPPVLHATPRGDAEVVIDGRLDESAWASAAVSSESIERNPVPRAEPPVQTDVRVLYDKDAIYVGLKLHHPADQPARAVTLTRDSFRIWSDDAVTVKFDVRLDHRTTVAFAVNAANAQIDLLALENGKDFRREYDAVWQSATHRGETYWSVEMRLPVAALGIAPVEGERIIGFQISRDHHERLATYDWSEMPQQFGPMSAIHYGELRGVKEIGGGLPISLIPYILLGHPNTDDPDLPGRLGIGGDLRVRVAEDVWTELTILTDFAQVDLDDPVVNHDRFPLFLPEKRPFFLTGSSVFRFGAPGVAQIFFSRRIGLDDDGNEVPILGGLKLYGRSGPVAFGVLDVLTDQAGDQPARNWTMARARWNATDTAHLGVMATLVGDMPLHGDRPFDPRVSVGIDGSARPFDDRFVVDAFWSASTSTTAGWGDSSTARLGLKWNGDAFRPDLELLWIGTAFEPTMGFATRPDLFRVGGTVPYVWRTQDAGLESITFTGFGRYDRSADFDRYHGSAATGGATVQWRNGVSINVKATWIEEIVEEEFELFGDVPVPAGDYRGLMMRTSATVSDANALSGSLNYTGGNHFYGGTLHQFGLSGALSAGAMVRLSANVSLSLIDLPSSDPIEAVTASGAFTLTPNTDIVADLIFQLNNIDEEAVALARIRWRFLPGSDAFLVYREDIPLDAPHESTRAITLKVAYRFDATL